LGLGGAPGTDATAAERISAKFPTSAIAVLTVPCAWKELELGVATLIDFEVPR
jgi:phosphohistidine phosphatase